MGTPNESVPTLQALVKAGHEVVLVITQPDRKRGRGSAMVASPVKQAALELGLNVSHKMADALDVEADIGVVIAFGRLIKSPVLEYVTWLNIHPSLLPRWRGATPVESSILGGDTHTGVCVMALEAGMDTGPVFKRYETDIEDNESSQHLSERLFVEGTRMLIELLDGGLPLPEPEPQVGEPTLAEKFTPESFHLDWSKSAEELSRVIRLGRAWTTFRDKRFRILEARVGESLDAKPGVVVGNSVATVDGSLVLVTVQPEGKGPQDAKSWANGAHPADGEGFA